MAGAHGNGGSYVFAPGAVWELDFAYYQAWTDLGNSLAGTNGAPLLAGHGVLSGGSIDSLALSNALPSSTAAVIIGLSAINFAFKSGVLVPAPDLLIFGLPTNGSGALTLPFRVAHRTAVRDLALTSRSGSRTRAGPKGFAASNALRGVTP